MCDPIVVEKIEGMQAYKKGEVVRCTTKNMNKSDTNKQWPPSENVFLK